MITSTLIRLLRLFRLKTRLQAPKPAAKRGADHGYADMSPVQRATAKAARKNPWMLAG